jgi:hypothetical protein
MTKEKTALTQLIEKIEQQKRVLKDHFVEGKWNDDRCSELDNCIAIASAMLPIEKQQIVDGIIWFDDTDRKPSEIEISAKQYFQNKFEQ